MVIRANTEPLVERIVMAASCRGGGVVVPNKFTDEQKYPPLLRLLHEWLCSEKTRESLGITRGGLSPEKCSEWMDNCVRALHPGFDPSKHSAALCYAKTHRTSVLALGFTAFLDRALAVDSAKEQLKGLGMSVGRVYVSPFICFGLIVEVSGENYSIVVPSQENPCDMVMIKKKQRSGMNHELFGFVGPALPCFVESDLARMFQPQVLGGRVVAWDVIDSQKLCKPEKHRKDSDQELETEADGGCSSGRSVPRKTKAVLAGDSESASLHEPEKQEGAKAGKRRKSNFTPEVAGVVFVKHVRNAQATSQGVSVDTAVPSPLEAGSSVPSPLEAGSSTEPAVPIQVEAGVSSLSESSFEPPVPVVVAADGVVSGMSACPLGSLKGVVDGIRGGSIPVESLVADTKDRISWMKRHLPVQFMALIESFATNAPLPERKERPDSFPGDIAESSRVRFLLSGFKDLRCSAGPGGNVRMVYPFRKEGGKYIIPKAISELMVKCNGFHNQHLVMVIEALQDGLLVYLFLSKLAKRNRMLYARSKIFIRMEKALNSMNFAMALWGKFGDQYLQSGGYFDTGSRAFKKVELCAGPPDLQAKYADLFLSYQTAFQEYMQQDSFVPESLARRLAYNNAFRKEARWKEWTAEVSKLDEVVAWFQRDKDKDKGPIDEVLSSLHVSRVYEVEAAQVCDEYGYPCTDVEAEDEDDCQYEPDFQSMPEPLVQLVCADLVV